MSYSFILYILSYTYSFAAAEFLRVNLGYQIYNSRGGFLTKEYIFPILSLNIHKFTFHARQSMATIRYAAHVLYFPHLPENIIPVTSTFNPSPTFQSSIIGLSIDLVFAEISRHCI